jgi:Na+/glutamate symporter
MVVVMTVVMVMVVVVMVVVVMMMVMVVIVVVVELAGHDYSLAIGRSLCLRGYDGSSLQTRATARPVHS